MARLQRRPPPPLHATALEMRQVSALPSYDHDIHISLPQNQFANSADLEKEQQYIDSSNDFGRVASIASVEAKTNESANDSPEKDAPPKKQALKPSLRLMFSLSSRRELLTLALPATLVSIASSLILPFTTIVLGRSFDSFSRLLEARADPDADPAAANNKFMHEQLVIFITMLVLALLIVIGSTVSMALWNINAEHVVRNLRQQFFARVLSKNLAWFDLGAGIDAKDDSSTDESGNGGSAALAGRFARDTDEVRMAVGQTFGLVVQSLFTAILCIILAFVRAPQLAPVILVTFPLVIITSGLVEKLTVPLVERDRSYTATASTKVERAISAIATVKAFNAEHVEAKAFLDIAQSMRTNYNKLTMFWGARIGISQFFLLMSFVQGFWFGNYLVQKGKLTGGQVTEVFWSCMIASSSVQAAIPYINTLTLGRYAMAGLLNIMNGEAESDKRPTSLEKSALDNPFEQPPTPVTPVHNPKRGHKKNASMVRNLRKIRPDHFTGELALRNVTFHYPTRPYPHPPVLQNVSLFIPPREMTFIVGQSGSGKSTIGSLLMDLYQPSNGVVAADDQDLRYLDPKWLRGHVAMVSQGASVLSDGTIHDNVALGAMQGLSQDREERERQLRSFPRDKVVEACRIALVHDFIRDLPDGYETRLSGEKGASLSGGQRQRLALARAYLRNPTVLILDEATSALDATSRLLVYEAIKRWRINMTTVVITHDLTPITSDDFVYVVEDGQVVEEGYRYDLNMNENGRFKMMATLQSGNKKEEDMEELPTMDDAVLMWHPPDRESSLPGSRAPTPLRMTRQSSYFGAPLETRGQFDWLEVLGPSGSADSAQTPHVNERRHTYLRSGFPALEMAAQNASAKRQHSNIRQRTFPTPNLDGRKHESEKVENNTDDTVIDVEAVQRPAPSLFKVMAKLLPCLPNRFRLTLGYLFCISAGITIPFFSTLLSSMLASLGQANFNQTLLKTGLLILLVASIDGISIWMKYTLLQQVAMNWVTDLRKQTYPKLLSQDKGWFDGPENSAIIISNVNVKDVAEARNVVGMISGQLVIVIVMVSFGMIWAMISGWQLTLIGMAVAPILMGVLIWQTKLLGLKERQNKDMRDDLTAKLHKVTSNIRAIRAMNVEPVFAAEYEEAVAKCHKGHVNAAFYIGVAYSVAQAMNTITQGVMLFVGALFVKNQLYTFSQMLQVFSLIVFSITFAGQTLSYVPALTRCVTAAADLLRLYELSEDTREARGRLTNKIDGVVSFENVNFAYPSRPDVQVTRELSFNIRRGECVGLVGPSGSGKSTITALLQRLYEPQSGQILLDQTPIGSTNVKYLRSHIAVVSQHPALFDMSVSDNIAYGTDATFDEVVRAAKQANAHDFIMQLPHQYDTNLGENASLISGGQAQRLQLARAIVKNREILILDECTSALDPQNQAIVMEAIAAVKRGRTTLIVTHKLDLMRMCDRLIVMDAGQAVESGTYEELVAKRGAFAALASSGEWQA